MLQIYHDYTNLDIALLCELYGYDDLEREPFCEYLQQVFFQETGACYAIWVEDSCYMSALRLERYEDGYLISGLHTCSEKRGMGYATSLLSAIAAMAREQGLLPLYSHIHCRNRVSMQLHFTCGFQKAFDFARLLDATVSNQYVTLRLEKHSACS